MWPDSLRLLWRGAEASTPEAAGPHTVSSPEAGITGPPCGAPGGGSEAGRPHRRCSGRSQGCSDWMESGKLVLELDAPPMGQAVCWAGVLMALRPPGCPSSQGPVHIYRSPCEPLGPLWRPLLLLEYRDPLPGLQVGSEQQVWGGQVWGAGGREGRRHRPPLEAHVFRLHLPS